MELLLTIVDASPKMIYVLLNVIVALPAFLLAVLANNDFLQKHPNHLGFKWGYFTGFSLILVSVFLLAGLFFLNPDDMDLEEATSSLLTLFIIHFLPGILIVCRNRWAWIFYTVISMNPVLWMLNIVYIKNRWREFSRGGVSDLSNSEGERAKSNCPHCGNEYYPDTYRLDAAVWLCSRCKSVLG